MAFPIYSEQLLSGILVGDGNVNAPVDAPDVLVVRDLDFALTPNTSTFTFVQVRATDATFVQWAIPPNFPTVNLKWRGRQVCTGPSALQIFINGVGSQMFYSCSGYRLTGP